MIVKMKKATLIMVEKDKKESLESLKKFGLVHVNEYQGNTDDIDKLEKKKTRFLQVLQVLEEYQGKDKKAKKNKKKTQIPDLNEIESTIQSIKDTDEAIKELTQQANFYRVIGNVQPSDFNEPLCDGFQLNLYLMGKKDVENIPEDLEFISVNTGKKNIFVITVNQRIEGYAKIEMPEKSLNEINEELNNKYKEREQLEKNMFQYSLYLEELNKELNKTEEKLEFQNIMDGIPDHESLVTLTGFLPEENAPDVKQFAEKNAIGLLLEDISEDDPVPTLIRNKGPIKIIQPIFDFLGTVPGYTEYDISFYFLIFFAVFFAMIIGDGGYGAVFFIGAILGHVVAVRKKASLKPIALLYVLSICTIAWGAVTGNWFGSVEIASIPFFKSLIIPQISAFPELFPDIPIDPQQKIMYICFILGAVQLSIACLSNTVKDFPRIKFLAQVGWLILIIGLYYVVLQLVLDIPTPSFIPYVLIAGLTMVVIFGQQEKGQNFFKGLLKGFAGLFTTFLDVIGSFSNIISYIRLFAVGMASLAIASSFNNIAKPLIGDDVMMVAAIAILFLGHGLNLIMGLLSVVVHGIRLNMLEFSGQLGMEWSGFLYKPFKENNLDSEENKKE